MPTGNIFYSYNLLTVSVINCPNNNDCIFICDETCNHKIINCPSSNNNYNCYFYGTIDPTTHNNITINAINGNQFIFSGYGAEFNALSFVCVTRCCMH